MNAEAAARRGEAVRQLRLAAGGDEQVATAARRQHALSMRLRTPGRPETVIKVARNSRCPCGSGLKFKRCCSVG